MENIAFKNSFNTEFTRSVKFFWREIQARRNLNHVQERMYQRFLASLSWKIEYYGLVLGTRPEVVKKRQENGNADGFRIFFITVPTILAKTSAHFLRGEKIMCARKSNVDEIAVVRSPGFWGKKKWKLRYVGLSICARFKLACFFQIETKKLSSVFWMVYST